MGKFKGLLCLLMMGVAAVTHAVTIDFNELSAWDINGESVPEEMRLSDHYLSTQGVVFSSLDPYVAVIQPIIPDSSVGLLGMQGGFPIFDTSNLITATFYNPSNSSEKSTVSQVTIEFTSLISPNTVSLTAYDISGAPIATNSVNNIISTEGEISVSGEGIHFVEFRGEISPVKSITFFSDGGSTDGEEVELWAPIGSVDLGTNVVKIIKDPVRSFVYALDKVGGNVLFIDLKRQEVVERLTVGASPNGADIDEAGKYLYVGHGGDGSGVAGSFRIEKIDLDSRLSVASFVVPSIFHNKSPLRAEHITCGENNSVYYNAAYTPWNGGLGRRMDGATGSDLGALAEIKSPMVMTPDKSKLYGQYVYYGNLGKMGAWDVSGSSPVKVDEYAYAPYASDYGWAYNNYSISGDGQLLSLGYKLFNANDLDDEKGDFDELIYGLNTDGSVAFGKTAIWDTTTFSDLGEATKVAELFFSSTVMDFDEAERRLFAFNTGDQTLRVFGEPNPLQVYSIHVVDIEAYEGGEFYPSNLVFALENSGVSNVSWSASAPAELSLIPDHGELASGERIQVTVSPDPSIPVGSYDYTLVFSNLTLGLERERGFGLTVYPAPQAPAAPFSPSPAHDTSLVPVVDVSVELEWEHVNAEDDAGPWNTASIYDVHMGTSPTGLASVASGSTNTVFNPGQLELNTTYYWQVVASNVVGVTPGPVWQFTTWKHGPVDHFEWTVPDAEQKIETPFEVTVRAVDENGVWVPDYTNNVEIVGLEKPSFVEDFEGGRSEGWLSTPGTTQSISITDTVSAVGTNSLLLQGYDENHEKYYYHDLPGGQPTDVEFRVRAENFYGYGANVQLRDGEGGAFAYFYLGYVDMRFNGWKIYDRYAGNQWYKINFKLDWATRRVECYVNGSYRTGGSFLSSADSVSHISLHNYDKSKTWIDEIRVEQSIPIPLETVPTNTVPLVDGEWSGEVVVGQAAETALFRATDALGHTGDSDLIAVAGYRGDLSIILPDRVDEGSGLLAGAGQLVVSPAPAGDLTVNLSADEGGLISVPAQVVIPAAQTNVFFDLQVSDDSLLKGSETTTLYALSDGYRAVEASMFVDDDETATLTLSLPQTTVEGSGFINGALQLDRAPDRDVVVELLSNNPDKVGSSNVVVPAGQTFVAFTLPVIDNAVIDGIQTATIEAFVQNWQSGIASVFIFDNENRQIDLQLPVSFLEGDGLATNAGSVTLSGSTTMDMHVLLTVSDSSELTVPGYVTVKAGQTAAFFDVTVPDDAEMDGTQRISVLAETPDYVPAVRYVDVQDNEVHHFEVFMTNTEVSVLAPVMVGISAKTIDGQSLPKVDGPLSLTASGDGGTVPVEPAVSTNLMQGIASSSIAFGRVDNNVVLTVSDGMGHSGTSSVFNVVGAVLSLQPAALTNTLVVAGESMTRTMVISNAGNADLEFEIFGGDSGGEPDPSLILHYTFDEDSGTTVTDQSGNGNDGTIMNSHARVAGIDGQGLMINGNSETYGSAGGHVLLPEIDFNSMTEATFALWVKEIQVHHTGGEAYLHIGAGPFENGRILLKNYYLDKVQFSVGTSQGERIETSPSAGEFVHYAITVSNGMMIAYRNGEQIGQTNATLKVDLPEYAALGRSWWNNGVDTSTRLTAVFDDVRIYNRALPSSEISALSGSDTDGESNHNLVTNGDFEEGNANFISAYEYSPDEGSVVRGTYTVDDDSAAWDTSLSATMMDHTSRTGQMMMVSGSMMANTIVWQQELEVVAGETYDLSAWVASLSSELPPILDFQINGVSVGSVTTEYITWTEFAVEWTAASSATAALSVVNTQVLPPFIPTGNKFAIDDISFMKQGTSSVQDDSLIAHFPFNGDASDESGHGHDGAVNGATLTADRFGNADSAYDFNGSSAYINCGNIINGFSNFTVMAWINIDRFTDTRYMGPWSQMRSSYNTGNGNYLFYTGSDTSVGCFGTSMRWDDSVGIDTRTSHAVPMNEWRLITQTYDGNTVRQYDNGILINAVETGEHTLGSEWDFLIGKTFAYPGYLTTDYFDGQIDDLRVYDRALSEEEILAELNSTDGNEPVAQGITITVGDDNSSGPVASFLFNGNPHDESNGFAGTISGGATLTIDRFGNPDSAYSFDGEAYITYGDVLDRGDTSHSYNVWVKTSTFDQKAVLLGKGISTYGSPSYDGWSIYNYPFDTGNGYHAIYGDHSGSSANVDRLGVSNETIPVNEWVMLSGVYDIEGPTAVLRLYVNGVLAGSESFPLPTTPSDDNLPFNIGGLYYGFGAIATDSGFVGDIDDVCIYNRVLSESEISELYNETDDDTGLIASYPFNGNASDESGNGHDGTVSGATLTTDRFGNADSAYLFDGTDDYIEVPDSTDLRLSGTDFSISTWFKETARTAGSPSVVLSKRGAGSANGWLNIINGASSVNDGKLAYMVSGGVDPSARALAAASLNEWTHSVLTYESSSQTLRFYLNGTLDSEHTGIPSPNSATTTEMFIGLDSALQTYAFHGAIDDIRIYNRALPESDVFALFNETDVVEPPEPASWLSAGPVSGTVAPGSSTTVRVEFDATGLIAGDYSNTVLFVLSNDALALTNSIPVSMVVVPTAPTMVDEPESTEGLSNELMWSPVAGPVEYWVEAATSTNSDAVQDSGWVGNTNHTFTGLSADTVYFYRTKASVQSSIGLLEGAWSDWIWSTQIAVPVNADGDGLPDWWEQMYFGGPTNANPLLDFDGDGQSNGDEFIAGMNPTNAGSLFMVDSVDTSAGAFVISWNAVTGRVYSVYWKNGMTNHFQALETDIRYPQNSYTDTVHVVEEYGFYCIDVELDNSSTTNPPVAELYQ